jgi:LacI family transcriptional regulator
MVTIKDVAKAANVAISTVSLALRNDPRVKESTRRRVLEAAAQLKYTPHGIARDLKVRKTETIGLLLNTFGGPFYSELIRGVQAVTVEHGYDLIASITYRGKYGSVARLLSERRVDGVIVLSPDVDDETILRAASQQLPIVVMDRELQAENVYSVQVDNEQGGYEVTKHLLQLGFKDIAFLSGPSDSPDNSRRYSGYLRALNEYGVSPIKRYEMVADFTEDGGYNAAVTMCALGNLPEAIFAANDEMAIGVIRAFQERGILVPDDVAVVGFDDIRLAEYVSPALTTIRQPMYTLGLVGAHKLFQALRGEVNNDPVKLPTELIVRKSSMKVRQQRD